jgi:hypothetical protein
MEFAGLNMPTRKLPDGKREALRPNLVPDERYLFDYMLSDETIEFLKTRIRLNMSLKSRLARFNQ